MSLDIVLFLRNEGHKYDLNSAESHLLIVLRYRIGKNNYTWIEQEELAKECRISIPYLQECLRSLRQKKLIKCEKDKIDKRRNNYKLNSNKIKTYKSKEEKCGTVANLSSFSMDNENTEKEKETINEQENTQDIAWVSEENTQDIAWVSEEHTIYTNNTVNKKETKKERERKKDSVKAPPDLPTPFPDNFIPTDEHMIRCNEKGLDINFIVEKLRSYAKHMKMVSYDWNAVVDKWIATERREEKKDGRKNTHDFARDLCKRLDAGESGETGEEIFNGFEIPGEVCSRTFLPF